MPTGSGKTGRVRLVFSGMPTGSAKTDRVKQV